MTTRATEGAQPEVNTMKVQRFFIGPDSTGIVGDVADALDHKNAPDHRPSDYEEVSQRFYEETILDLRYEGGEWFQ